MKTPHATTEQVAHLWANRAQDSAQSYSLHFHGDYLVSYALTIGRHASELKDKRVVLFLYYEEGDQSNTTAQHIGMGFLAISDEYEVLRVFNPRAKTKDEHKQNFKSACSIVLRWRGRAERAVKEETRDKYNTMMMSVIDDINRYCELFGLKERIKVENLNALEDARQRDIKRKAAKERREAKAREKTAQENLKRWLAGDDKNSRPAEYINCATYLRRVENRVQTTSGAEVHIKAAKKLFSTVSSIKASGATYAWRYGDEIHPIEIGGFKVRSIDKHGNLVVGCHEIKWPQIESFAKTQGWL